MKYPVTYSKCNKKISDDIGDNLRADITAHYKETHGIEDVYAMFTIGLVIMVW